jgi:hypothetical protein
MKTLLLTLAALLGLCFIAAAADITGEWKAEVPASRGTETTTFNLTASGTRLTGNIVNQNGQTAIEDGRVDGDRFAFSQTATINGSSVKVTYTGVVKGDTIQLTRDAGKGPKTLTAKRAQ